MVFVFLSHLHDGELIKITIMKGKAFLSHLHDGEPLRPPSIAHSRFLSHLHDGELCITATT